MLPPVAAVVAALQARTLRRAAAAIGRGASFGCVLALAGFLSVLVHGLRVGFCDPSEGLWLFVLGPGIGTALGGAWGGAAAWAALRFERPRGSRKRTAGTIALALAGPVAGVLVSALRFYTSPMVFAFDPFFGVFSGPLYDTVVSVVDRLISYRAGTAATLVAFGLGAALVDDARDMGALPALRQRPGVALLALAAAGASLWHSASGPRLGHWSTSGSIAEALGGRHEGRRCDVVHARALALRDVRLFARDCDAALLDVEKYLDARGPERVVVYLFANDAEKGWLMGASRTYIAKPWRGEVYVQAAPFPHPVIAHELAHVVAGSFARGPFRVAGSLGGLWPDPGRIEGFAVAAAPDEDDELTAEEWAASMLELRLLPELRAVFELDFLTLNAAKAYTVAGAFVGFLRRTYGAPAIRRWYAGEALSSVTHGKDLAALERDFHAVLRRTRVPERARYTAQARFERPSFFARRCPRIVDRALGEAAQRLDVGDVRGALEGYLDALRLDRGNVDARFGLAACARRKGDWARALSLTLELAKAADLPKALRSRALETAGDLELARGRGAEARGHYAAASELVFSEDRQRTLDVKSYASEGRGREPVTALLIGEAELGPSWDVAAPLVQAWAEAEPTDDVPEYLIGRNILLHGRYAEASRYLDRSLRLEPRLASVRREALRLRLTASCALGDVTTAEGVLRRAVSDPGLTRARREGLERIARRCGVPNELSSKATPASSGSAARAAPAATATERCPQGMLPVPGGKFWVGSDPKEEHSADESPRYLTELAPFCLDETEVTAAAYASCADKSACRKPERAGSILCNFERAAREAHPMNCLTWSDAAAFCKQRGARLPTEAEFEYAARGGGEHSYPWGNDPPDGRACWKHAGTCAVKSFAAGAFGLFDVSGNVWEWTHDWYGPYPWPPAEGFARVFRGGSFSRRFEKWMHTRLRERAKPSEGGAHLGFRCAFTPDTARCPFGLEEPGLCRHGVLDRPCGEGKRFNGARCAEAGEPRCGGGWLEKPGQGCVLERPIPPEIENPEATAALVTSGRSPGDDADCAANSPGRPRAFRYEGGTHAARSLVSRKAGCKNRDVGVGWNSTCCP